MKTTKQYTNPNNITEALKNLGLKSKEAAVLAFLMRNQDEPVSQWDIERALQLRQPYVSAALKTLEHHNWVDVSVNYPSLKSYGFLRKGLGTLQKFRIPIRLIDKQPVCKRFTLIDDISASV